MHFHSSSVIELSAKIAEISGKYESKFLLEGGILEARFEPTLIKNSLNLSVITFLSVIYSLFILKVLEKFS